MKSPDINLKTSYELKKTSSSTFPTMNRPGWRPRAWRAVGATSTLLLYIASDSVSLSHPRTHGNDTDLIKLFMVQDIAMVE